MFRRWSRRNAATAAATTTTAPTAKFRLAVLSVIFALQTVVVLGERRKTNMHIVFRAEKRGKGKRGQKEGSKHAYSV
jgi:hypothetical protein